MMLTVSMTVSHLYQNLENISKTGYVLRTFKSMYSTVLVIEILLSSKGTPLAALEVSLSLVALILSTTLVTSLMFQSARKATGSLRWMGKFLFLSGSVTVCMFEIVNHFLAQGILTRSTTYQCSPLLVCALHLSSQNYFEPLKRCKFGSFPLYIPKHGFHLRLAGGQNKFPAICYFRP